MHEEKLSVSKCGKSVVQAAQKIHGDCFDGGFFKIGWTPMGHSRLPSLSIGLDYMFAQICNRTTSPLCLGAKKALEYKCEVNSWCSECHPQYPDHRQSSSQRLAEKNCGRMKLKIPPTRIDFFSCRQGQLILLVVLRVLMQSNLVLSDSTALEYCILLLFSKTPHSQ